MHTGRSSRLPRWSSLAGGHLEPVQKILKEAKRPEKVDVIPALNKFNQIIGRATALLTLFPCQGEDTAGGDTSYARA